MSLKEKILSDMKTAMKGGDKVRLEAIRFLQSAVKYAEIELRPKTIEDSDILGVIKKLIKQRKESIDQFGKAGRQDLVDKEAQELAVLEDYMPEQMSAEQVAVVVQEVITSLNATSLKQMGAVMKEVVARTKGQADNKLVSDLVKARLQ